MKPYIAILIDSFWEAVGNKVLWALLIGWSLVLAGLAPFGYITRRSFQLSSVDIENRSQLIQKLADASRGKGRKPVQAIAQYLEPPFRQRLQAAADDSSGGRRLNSSELAAGLNAVLTERGLYSEEVFPTAKLRDRLQALTEMPADARSEDDLEQLNRELLQLALPLELNPPRGEQLWIGYAGFKIGDPLPISRRQIEQFLEPILLGTIIKLGLGILAIFVAIVVTSPIMPDTFRSGSLHLLLSKPISRVWLYLSKFFGSCIFILVNITFVLIGLYCIAGLRFDIWNAGLLACIPLLMFVFVIFYSVSALVGLVWGNAIVCVVACMVFWLFCFSIGFLHEAVRPQIEVLPQITRALELDQRLLAVNEKGQLNVWNSHFSVWQPALESDVNGQARTFGPFFDPEQQLLIVKSFERQPFGELRARSRKLSLIRLGSTEASDNAPPTAAADDGERSAIDADDPAVLDIPSSPSEGPAADPLEGDMHNGQPPLQSAEEARESPVWISDPGPELPHQMFDLVQLEHSLFAICRVGLFRLDLRAPHALEADQPTLLGFSIPWMKSLGFQEVTPADFFLGSNTTAAATADRQGLIIYSSGNLDHLRWEDNALKSVASTKLDGDGTEAALVQMNADYCVVVRDQLPLLILDSQLQTLAEVPLPEDQDVRQLAWIPDTQHVAILTHLGNLLRLDCAKRQLTTIAPALQGQCTSQSWIDTQQVWLGIKPNGLVLFDTRSGAIRTRITPSATTWERVFRWVIRPLYVINPKPAALDSAVGYLLSGDTTQTLGLITNDLNAAQLEIDIWTPIFSNLAFVIVMLTIACIIVSRKEF